MGLFSQQPSEFIGRQPGAFGNRSPGDGIDGIVAGNDEALPAVGHHDMPALPGDLAAQLFKYSDSVPLADARNFWRNLNGDKFAGEARPVGLRLAPGILLRDFEPQLNGLSNVGQCFRVRRALAVAARQGRTGDGKTFVRFNHDDLILHHSQNTVAGMVNPPKK